MTRALARAAALSLAASALMASAAHASDPRLIEHMFDPMEVVQIDGKPNIQATIAFGENELIENVAIGDSGSWQVTPNKRANLLFVKPLSPNATTNMTVVTNERTYFFDLVASPKSKPMYVFRFQYPEAEKAATPPVQMAQGPNDLERQAMDDPFAVRDPEQLNFAWGKAGPQALLPSQIYDDGQATFIAWPAGEPIPAILVMNEDKIEGPVNYAVRGDTVVVDGVPHEIILRSGEDKAVLTHQGPPRSARKTTSTPHLAISQETK